MRKISIILLLPLCLSFMTFMRRFLYDSVIMFFISFMFFFVSLYADFDRDRNSRRKWSVAAAAVTYASAVFFVCDTETTSITTLILALLPSVTGMAEVLRLTVKSHGEAGLTVKPN